MSHAYTSILIHFVFSTKDRRPLISEDLQPKLWAYMGGIARVNKFKALAIGGIEAVQLVKGGSSKWMNDQNVRGRSFAWQDAYGAPLAYHRLRTRCGISIIRSGIMPKWALMLN